MYPNCIWHSVFGIRLNGSTLSQRRINIFSFDWHLKRIRRRKKRRTLQPDARTHICRESHITHGERHVARATGAHMSELNGSDHNIVIVESMVGFVLELNGSLKNDGLVCSEMILIELLPLFFSFFKFKMCFSMYCNNKMNQ